MAVKIRMPGIRTKVETSKLHLDVEDDSLLLVSKYIIDSDEFRAIGAHARHIRAYLKAKGLPSPILRGGVYMIPLSRLEMVEKFIEEAREDNEELVEKLLGVYHDQPGGLIHEARERLGSKLFDIRDYPSSPELRRAFGIEVEILSTDVPGKLRSVSQAMFNKYRQQAEQRWKDYEQNIVQLMRAEFKQVVDGMVNALGTREDGKKRALRGSTVDKLSEFLKEAPFRNVADDKELARLVTATTQLLDGFDTEIVRADDRYRDAVRESFEIVKAKLDTLVVEAPTRDIEFAEAG